jgi:hypothetical protein
MSAAVMEELCRCGSPTKPCPCGCPMLKCSTSNAYVFNCGLNAGATTREVMWTAESNPAVVPEWSEPRKRTPPRDNIQRKRRAAFLRKVAKERRRERSENDAPFREFDDENEGGK